ncbi:MAG TPA: hydroxymethylglutaryl-CoA reductase, degradative [Candidatus Methanomethylicus sp.]|nr:hydroxymethylglutaryl-CoA reductase, degradative [Candidatus Methanomethylicus sp.]
MTGSQLPGFYKRGLDERRLLLKEVAGVSDDDLKALAEGLTLASANLMVENAIGTMQVPLGVATNFKINGRELLIPMATEEASVIAAASYAAKLALPAGFTATSTRPIMRGQMQLVDVEDASAGKSRIEAEKDRLIAEANKLAGLLPALGGGVIDLKARVLEAGEEMLIVEFFIDCRDAMGANTIDTVVEGMTAEIESIAKGRALLRILSNLATERLAKATVTYKKESIGGESVVDGVIRAYRFAAADPYRAATNNKGIMNGITALVLATGNDTRAVEAGAHAYAAMGKRYTSLSKWSRDAEGNLHGELELPMAVGTIGGATKTHPTSQFALKLMGIKSARELAETMAALGLAQNFAALRALVTEGIQKGHMQLHARNVAAMAGATGPEGERIAEILAKEGNFSVARAKELLGR